MPTHKGSLLQSPFQREAKSLSLSWFPVLRSRYRYSKKMPRACQPRPGRVPGARRPRSAASRDRYFPRAAKALGTVSLGLTLYQAWITFPCSSRRKEERIMPSYSFPYIDFLPQVP